MLSLARALSVTALLVAGTALRQHPETRFASQRCHIAFRHPTTWEVVRDTMVPDDPCAFRLRPRDWERRLVDHDSIDVFTVGLRANPVGIRTALENGPFRRQGSRWVVLGRQDLESPAASVTGPGWHGVRGTAIVGCYREGGDGAYVGLCDTPTAIVGTPRRSLELEAGPKAEDVFNRILATLRLP